MLIEGLKIRAFSLEPAVKTGLLKTLKTKPEMTKIAPAAKSAGMVTIWITQYLRSCRISRKGLSPVLRPPTPCGFACWKHDSKTTYPTTFGGYISLVWLGNHHQLKKVPILHLPLLARKVRRLKHPWWLCKDLQTFRDCLGYLPWKPSEIALLCLVDPSSSSPSMPSLWRSRYP